MIETQRLVEHVYFSGPEDGIPVFFLHGNFSAALYWEETMLKLPAGYRAVAPDLRGFGWSEDVRIDATRGMRDWSDDLVALMDALTIDRAHFVGWSMGGGILYRLVADHPQRVLTATLVCPISPYGIGGTKGAHGTPCFGDFAGSGGGMIDPEFVERIRTGDRSDTPGSPRSIINRLYYAPPFRTAREEDFLTASLTERTGADRYPGDRQPSPHWPYFAPGRWGPINAMSPRHLGDAVIDLLAAGPKPPLLWIRGSEDRIVSDQSITEPGMRGKLGLLEGWPGEEVYPTQPMIAQTRAVLEQYAAHGGRFREQVAEHAAHSPHIEQPELFRSWLAEFWESSGHGRMSSSSQRPYRPAPEIQELLDELNAIGNDLDRLTPTSAVDLWLERELSAKRTLKPIPVGGVLDLAVSARNRQIPIRIYTPSGGESGASRKPAILIYLHGGGWTLGSIAMYDSVARVLANQIPAAVVSVDYRLAPEHPFPAALEDARLAVEWVVRNADVTGGDPNCLVLAGDSAGGTLATVIALEAREDGIPIVFQALFYPSTNISRTDGISFRQYGEGYLLTKKAVESFRSFYLPNQEDWRKPEVSPLLMSDERLRQMPPALVITAGCDPLREEGEVYANRLRANGVSVTYRVEEEMIHAFLSFFNTQLYAKASPLVEPILDRVVEEIRKRLTGGGETTEEH